MPWRKYKKTDPRRQFVHLMSRLGRRGTILLLVGGMWIAQGAALFIPEPTTGYVMLDSFLWFRSILWIVTGLIALRFAFKKQGDDAPGWLALYIMPCYRALAYLVGFVDWWLVFPPFTGEGNAWGVVGFLSWATTLIILVVIAGWREPSVLHHKE